VKKTILRLFKRFGYKIENINQPVTYPDMEPEFIELAKKCKPFTMTSTERLYAIYKSVEYLVYNDLDGDFVECGVWKGGSSMMIALSLLKFKLRDRKIYLYDTYEGMSQPTEDDINYANNIAKIKFEQSKNSAGGSDWCRSEIDEVKKNLYSTGYPKENLIFIKGKVEDTLPGHMPEKLVLLRLDTDWYESTLHEMEHLYPVLTKKGVLIIDDYGHWRGCKKAIDEYFQKSDIRILLNRIDFTGRIGIKN